MGIYEALLCIAFTTFAASYAWGMRGTLIGGEKGAMLPGAFIGLIIAWFSGGAIRDSFWIPAAAGLMGMTFGGTEPYGETIGMVLHRNRPDHNPVKGYTGLAFKGALWFSICGGFIALSLASMSGSIYKVTDIIIFCLLIPVIQQVGYRLFNCPYDKQKKVYPRIFFSLTRREEWGSNFLLLIAMIAIAVIKGDDFTLIMIAGGFFFGAIGWFVAMKFYVLSVFPMKNGRYIFGKFFRKGLIDGWKIMEFTLGAIGGFGLSLTFCLNFEFVKEHNIYISQSGRWMPAQIIEDAMPYVSVAVVMAIAAVNLYSFICDKKDKKINSFILDQIERPFYNVIPMMFVLLGSQFMARSMTVFILVFVALNKCVFDRFTSSKYPAFWQLLSAVVCACVFAGDILLDGYPPFAVIVAGTVPYLLFEFIWVLTKDGRRGKTVSERLFKTSFITVFPFLAFQSAVLLAVSYKIFNV